MTTAPDRARLDVGAESEPGQQDDGGGGDAAHEVGAEPAEDQRGAADRRDEQLVEVAAVDLGHQRQAGRRGGHREHQRDGHLEGDVALAVQEGRGAGERLRDLADVDRQEEERDEERRDRRLRIADDLPHRAPAEQQDLGHGATALAAASSSARPRPGDRLRRPPGAARSPPGRRRPATAARPRSHRPRRPRRPAGARSRRSRPRRPRRTARARPARRSRRSRPGSSPITCWVRSASAPCSSTETTSLPISAFRSSGVPLGDDLAGVDDREALAELVGLLQVLGRQEDRRPARR